MTLEQQVTSLELSKRLKELGVKQESLFYWVASHKNDGIFSLHRTIYKKGAMKEGCIFSAFTVAELGEMLPDHLGMYDEHGGWLICEKVGLWEIGYTYKDKLTVLSFEDKSEANARAKMLIYLIENGLLEVEK